MSHLGFGAEFGNFVMLVLLALVAVVAIRFVMRRFSPAQAGAAARPAIRGRRRFTDDPGDHLRRWCGGRSHRGANAPTSATPVGTVASRLPADFDAPGFERLAKMIFIRLQAANDVGDLNDLRAFTTPEMFASIKLDLQDRGNAAQRTDVVRVDAEVLDVAREAERQIVSVRFHGLIQEDGSAPPRPFDEVWHLVKPADGSREWAIAGIQPSAAGARARRLISLEERRTGADVAAVDILALGEAMVEFNQTGAEDGRVYLQGFGGDTSNFAISAARQGARVGYLSAVGDDAYGAMLRDLWRSEGIEQGGVRTDGDAFTAIYIVTHDAAGHHFSFFRRGSAASRLAPAQLPRARDRGGARASSLGHLAGALGDRARDRLRRDCDRPRRRRAGLVRHQPAPEALADRARARRRSTGRSPAPTSACRATTTSRRSPG